MRGIRTSNIPRKNLLLEAFVCAILDDGTVKCWGNNYQGQLGYGDPGSVIVSGNFVFSNRGDEPNEMGANLPFVDLGTGKTAKQISSGTVHTCAILNDDSLKCWGAGANGKLGYGDVSDRGDGPNEMGDNLPWLIWEQERKRNKSL